MIRKSTLIVLLLALIAGGAVYFFDWRRGEKEKEKPPEDTAKSAFNAQAADVSSITITRPARAGSQPISLQKRDGSWLITQPIATTADPTVLDSIATDISAAHIAGTLPATPDRLKVYNLDPPQVILDFQLQNGTKHTVRFGDRDFNGTSAYSIIDGSNDVSLLPYSLCTMVDKSLDDLRDHAVLRITGNDIVSFDLKNPSGEFAANKDASSWKFSKPAGQAADPSDVTSLLNSVSAARMTIVSETADNPAKYGLASPSITFTATDTKGKTSALLVGKKIDNDFFARDASRPMVFRIHEDLQKKIAEGYPELRDKRIVRIDPHDVNRIEIHNSNGDAVFTRAAAKDKDEDWTVESPADQKGKTAGSWKFFTPTVEARAESVMDTPPAKVTVALAKPTVFATLVTTDGKKLTLSFSAPDDGSTYVRTSDGPAVYKLDKKIFENLDFKAKDVVF